jgi:hypothetical protein
MMSIQLLHLTATAFWLLWFNGSPAAVAGESEGSAKGGVAQFEVVR